MSKKILILGANGLIGNNIFNFLKKKKVRNFYVHKKKK
jgi:dTDP-4-dehydrorhamnose reductase